MAWSVTPVEPRNCTICGQLIPRGRMTPSRYNSKLTCGSACRSEIMRRVVSSRFEPDDLSKRHPCAICGQDVPRRATDSYRSKYLKRRTCSQRCRRQLASSPNRKPLKPKRCAVCKKLMPVPQALLGTKVGKDRHDWRRRKQTCSPECWRALAGRRAAETNAQLRRVPISYAKANGISVEAAKLIIRGHR